MVGIDELVDGVGSTIVLEVDGVSDVEDGVVLVTEEDVDGGGDEVVESVEDVVVVGSEVVGMMVELEVSVMTVGVLLDDVTGGTTDSEVGRLPAASSFRCRSTSPSTVSPSHEACANEEIARNASNVVCGFDSIAK